MCKLRKTELVGLEPLQHTLELTFCTSYVKYENPTSLIILGQSGAGKTEIMKKYRGNNGIHGRQRLTAYGIQRDLLDGNIQLLFEKGRKILGHVVVYDMSDVLDFKQQTIHSNIQFICAFTGEGLSPQATYALRSKQTESLSGIRGGFVIGVNTHGFFNARNHVKMYLFRGGLINRFVPFSHSESSRLHQDIMDSIKRQDYRVDKKFVNLIRLKFPKKRVDIKISSSYAEYLEQIAADVSQSVSEDLCAEQDEKRLLKSLITLAKASAVREGHSKVKESDVDTIKFLSNWMNFKMRNFHPKYRFYRGLN